MYKESSFTVSTIRLGRSVESDFHFHEITRDERKPMVINYLLISHLDMVVFRLGS